MLKQRNLWIQIFLHVLFILISVPLFNFISFNTTEVRNHLEKVRLHCPSSLSLYPVWPVFRKQNKTVFSFFPPHYIQTARQKAFLPVPWFLSPSLISIFMVNPYHISLRVSHESAPYKFYCIQNRGKLAVCDGGNIYSHQEGLAVTCNWLLAEACPHTLPWGPTFLHMPSVRTWKPAGHSAHILWEAADTGGRVAISLPEHISSVFW